MKSRRQFMKQGALVTTALFAAKPFKTFSGVGSSLSGGNYNHLVFLHTAENDIPAFGKTAGYINTIKSGSPGTILVHSGKKDPGMYDFDISSAESKQLPEYDIVAKNGVNAGVIFIKEGEANAVEKVNQLAALLKKEKDCQLVVCISQLGYQHKYAMDDTKLAAGSQNLDLIIGGHPENFTAKTMVLRNSMKHEVIIQSSKGNERDCSKIEFSFDNAGSKKHVHVATRLYKHAVTA